MLITVSTTYFGNKGKYTSSIESIVDIKTNSYLNKLEIVFYSYSEGGKSTVSLKDYYNETEIKVYEVAGDLVSKIIEKFPDLRELAKSLTFHDIPELITWIVNSFT